MAAEQDIAQIARSLKTLTGWVVFAIMLSIIGGIIMGVQYANQQSKLQKILDGTSSGDCSDPTGALYDPSC